MQPDVMDNTADTHTNRLEGVEPVFFQHKDVVKQSGTDNKANELRPYEVCVATGSVVGDRNVIGAQNVRGIWRVYLKSRECRVKLLIKGLTLRHTRPNLFDKNPKATNISNPLVAVEKITIKDIPLSVANSEIADFLQEKS